MKAYGRREKSPRGLRANKRTRPTANHRCFICDVQSGLQELARWHRTDLFDGPCAYRKRLGLPAKPVEAAGEG